MLYLTRWHWFKYGIWPWIRRGAVVGFLVLVAWKIFGCAVVPESVPTTVSKESEFKDPLAIGQRQKKSVALLVDKFGDPELFYSWADDDFKIEVLRWESTGMQPERWAIRINDIYKFTWTQWKEKKE